MDRKWYVVHTQAGQEEKVKANIENRAARSGMQEYFSKILIPTEEIAEVRGKKKRITTRRTFPGYVLVQVELVDDVQNLVRATPGVTGFVGAGRKPVPLSDEEVENILKTAEDRKAKPKPRVDFARGDTVRIVEGPFANFTGTVEEADPEKGKMKAMISIFGRSTPVELEYWQVERS